MGRGEDKILDLLLNNTATRRKASQYLSIARAKVTSDNGYATPPGHLAALCAFLAAIQENDDAVNETTVKSTLCIGDRPLQAYLKEVRDVLDIEQTARPKRSPRKAKPKATFDALSSAYDISADAIVGMKEAQQELVTLLDRTRATSSLAVCVIFWWACEIIGLNKTTLNTMEITLGEDFELSGAQWDGMLQNVHKCSDARKALRKAARAADPVKTAKPRGPKLSAVAMDLLMGNTPSAKGQASDEHKIVPQVESQRDSMQPPASPLKRRKDEMVVDDTPNTSPRKRRLTASTSTSSLARTSRSATAVEDESTDGETTVAAVPTNLKGKPVKEHIENSTAQTVKPAQVVVTDDVKARTSLSSPNTTTRSKSTPSKAYPAKTRLESVASESPLKTPNKSPSKSDRRLTRSGRYMGAYHEDSDNEAAAEFDSDDEADAAVDPTRNLFTRVLSDSEATDGEASGGEDDALHTLGRRRGAVRPVFNAREQARKAKATPASLLMRGGDRVKLVFRDRQALYEVDPVITARLLRFRQVQAKAAVAEAPLPTTRTTRKRKSSD